MAPRGSYRFQHALYQQVLYERLGTARRVQLHRRIGARLEAGYGARAGEIAAQLAVHFERGGETVAGRPLLAAGGGQCRPAAMPITKRSPPCTKGWRCWRPCPESPERAQHELTLQLTLGELLRATQGRGGPGRGRRLHPGPCAVPAGGGDAAARCGSSGASRSFI